jgi:hypothetical protein
MLALTIGSMQGRASVMVKEAMTTGWKSRILGYMSSGDSVPDVITTDWNRASTGRMAIDESMHLSYIRHTISKSQFETSKAMRI